MVGISVLCAFAGILQAAVSRSLPPRADPDDEVLNPKLKSDLKKDDAVAQWAPEYPKRWGFEDFRLQFNDPEPDDTFGAAVTEDEKYVAMFNGSHVTFVDLDSKTAVSTLNLGLPSNLAMTGLTLRPTPHGGYDVLTSGGTSRYTYPDVVFRRRVASDLKSIGELISYPSGQIGDIKNGKMATTDGYIYDLDSTDGANVTLKNPPSITGMSFSGDGQYVSTVGWVDMSADLWNATSGEKILQFPRTNAQNWLTKISPDNKYIVISLGTRSLQLYSLANLTAAPIVLKSFNNWIRSIEWSPDGKYLATGDSGRMQLWKFPEVELVQTWEVDGSAGGELYEISLLTWLDNGKKLSWMYREGRYMYDFEKNLKWWWNLGLDDHSWGRGGISFLKKRGYVATADGDSRFRFWKV